MNSHHNFGSFNIESLIKQYKGKRIEDVFPNHRIRNNKLGSCMEIYWDIANYSCNLDLKLTRKKLLTNLKTIYYIGEKIERKLLKKGVLSLFDLKYHLKYCHSVNNILESIRNKDYRVLCEHKDIFDLDVLFCFEKEELLFLDIETLGLYADPIILVGLGFFKMEYFMMRIIFARNLDEEMALLEHLRINIFPHFKCFISYNGKSFDIPYIANRFLYFFDENPMIFNDEITYQHINTKFHHVDLYHNCRRKFKGEFANYTLTQVEKELLGFKRKNKLTGNLVGECYKLYQQDPRRYAGVVKEVIEHNFWDVYSLPLILETVIKR